jgi:hypothetical protein
MKNFALTNHQGLSLSIDINSGENPNLTVRSATKFSIDYAKNFSLHIANNFDLIRLANGYLSPFNITADFDQKRFIVSDFGLKGGGCCRSSPSNPDPPGKYKVNPDPNPDALPSSNSPYAIDDPTSPNFTPANLYQSELFPDFLRHSTLPPNMTVSQRETLQKISLIQNPKHHQPHTKATPTLTTPQQIKQFYSVFYNGQIPKSLLNFDPLTLHEAYSLYMPDQPLEDAYENFLADNEKSVLLVSGLAGCGKSLFLKMKYYELLVKNAQVLVQESLGVGGEGEGGEVEVWPVFLELTECQALVG